MRKKIKRISVWLQEQSRYRRSTILHGVVGSKMLRFIDYQKAFVNVRHNQLLLILQKTGINEKDIRIIHKLYWNQTASEWAELRKQAT